MTIKAYDGTAWQTQKSLKIYNGSAWTPAKQAWIFNGFTWAINYPEYPSASANPGISVTSGIDGRIGCTYSASTGSWNSNEAYNPASYTYQWTRSNVDISGATTSTYTTTAADAEKVIGIKIKATNQRGDTTISATSGSTMLPQVTSLTAINTTQALSAPSVTFTPSNLSYSGSWTSVSNATNYETLAGGTAGTPSVDVVNRLFSGTGTAGSASFSVRAVNTNRTVSLSWGSAAGAVSYDIYVNGSSYTNTSSTTYTYSAPDDNARNFTVYPRSTNIQGYGATTSSPIAAPATYSSYGTGSGTLIQPNATSPTYASGSASSSSLSVSWGGSSYATKYRVYWTSASSISLDPASSYDTETTSTSASFSGSFTEGNNYYFYISASGDNNNWTPYGAYKASGTVAYTAPAAPAPSTSSITYNSFNISWTAISGAASYSVKVGTYSGGSNIVNTTTTNASYPVSSLSPSTDYYVTIAAYKTGYGYGSDGTATASTTANPTITFYTPTTPTFYRSGSTMKWGMDNPSWSGPLSPFGIEWEVRASASSGGTLITGGNTKSYTTSYTSTSGLGSIWNYIVSSAAGDLPATTSARYLRFRIYGQNSVTYAFVDGPWSAFV
jgi:hypothetical protein